MNKKTDGHLAKLRRERLNARRSFIAYRLKQKIERLRKRNLLETIKDFLTELKNKLQIPVQQQDDASVGQVGSLASPRYELARCKFRLARSKEA